MLGYLSAYIICSEKRTVTLSENCDFRGTDSVQGQISEHIVLIILQIFFATRAVLKIGHGEYLTTIYRSGGG